MLIYNNKTITRVSAEGEGNLRILNRTRHQWVALTVMSAWAATNPMLATAQTDEAAEPVALLSAFFGLDNKLPFRANLLCPGASGLDGMPVILSRTVDPETLQPEDFRVVTASGSERIPHCVTLRPAQDPGEHRTVLLIGEFGNADEDPPASVLVVGDLLSDGTRSQQAERANFRGSHTTVTPLSAGPSLVLAERVPLLNLATQTRGTPCPEGTQQVVRVTWAGGVRRPDREEPGDAERRLYRVTVAREDSSAGEIEPAALADLRDGDNNHLLCLDTADTALSVGFPAGHLVDPNQDLNPDTQIAVHQGVN